MLWAGCCRRRNTRTSKCSSACSVNAECRSVRCQTSAVTNMNTSYKAGSRDGADQYCKHSETLSVSIVRGWFVKTQSVSDTSGSGVTLLMAQHNGIIVTRMEMGMTTGLNCIHCVCVRACVRARGVKHRHDGSSLVLHCHVPQLACSQTNRLCPSNKTNFLCFGTVSFEVWCWRSLEKISWADRVRNEELLDIHGISHRQ